MSMPNTARMLLTSRMKGKVYSVVSGEVFDVQQLPYSVICESRFLEASCNHAFKSTEWSCLGVKNMLIVAGSKVFVHRDRDGKVIAMVVAPSEGALQSSSELVTALGSSKYDAHSIRSSCDVRLGIE